MIAVDVCLLAWFVPSHKANIRPQPGPRISPTRIPFSQQCLLMFVDDPNNIAIVNINGKFICPNQFIRATRCKTWKHSQREHGEYYSNFKFVLNTFRVAKLMKRIGQVPLPIRHWTKQPTNQTNTINALTQSLDLANLCKVILINIDRAVQL